MQLRPMLQVRDVAASSRWYQETLGLRSAHGGDEYEMLFDGDNFVLQLHRLDAHEHGELTATGDERLGIGVSLWFATDDRSGFDALIGRITASGTTFVEPPHFNPQAHHHEAMLRDPDGYVVMVNSPFELPTGS